MSTRITTYKALQERLDEIVTALAGDFRLALAAVANPVLALEELGYELAPRVRQTLEERARHPRRRLEKLRGARKELDAAAGRPVDPDSPDALAALLNTELGLDVPESALAPLPFRRPRVGEDKPQPADPLAAYADAHPVIRPLLAYRALQASTPPLAAPELFRALRSGDVDPPLTELRVRRAGTDTVLATAKRS